MDVKYSCPNFKPPNTLHDNIMNPPTMEGMKEIPIYIDSKDRSIDVYPDPFSFKVSFNPIGNHTPQPHISEIIRNVKLIKLEYLTLPMSTNFTKVSSGTIIISWKEFDVLFKTNDNTVRLQKNLTDNKIIIVANEKDITTDTFIRKNQVLFSALKTNDRIKLTLTRTNNISEEIIINIEHMDNDDDKFFIVSQETYDGNFDDVENIQISKVRYNELLNRYDDYHDKIGIVINKNPEVNIGKDDTIFMRGKYFFIDSTVSNRVLLNQSIDRTFSNLDVELNSTGLIKITSPTTHFIYDDENNIKLQSNYFITITIDNQTFDEILITQVTDQSFMIHDDDLKNYIDDLDSPVQTVEIIMWQKFEEVQTITIASNDSLVNQRYISLRIKEFDSTTLSTNQSLNDSFAVLNTERYGNGNIIVYPNADRVFENQNIINVSSLTFSFYDQNGKQIKTKTYEDYFKNKAEYEGQTKLMIHPHNKASQILFLFKIGVIEQSINRKIFC